MSLASMSDVMSTPLLIWTSVIKPLASLTLAYVLSSPPEIFVVVRSASVSWWRIGMDCAATTTTALGPPTTPFEPKRVPYRNVPPAATMASPKPRRIRKRPPPARGLAGAGATAKTKSPPESDLQERGHCSDGDRDRPPLSGYSSASEESPLRGSLLKVLLRLVLVSRERLRRSRTRSWSVCAALDGLEWPRVKRARGLGR